MTGVQTCALPILNIVTNNDICQVGTSGEGVITDCTYHVVHPYACQSGAVVERTVFDSLHTGGYYEAYNFLAIEIQVIGVIQGVACIVFCRIKYEIAPCGDVAHIDAGQSATSIEGVFADTRYGGGDADVCQPGASHESVTADRCYHIRHIDALHSGTPGRRVGEGVIVRLFSCVSLGFVLIFCKKLRISK